MITVDQERHKVAEATADFFSQQLSKNERRLLTITD